MNFRFLDLILINGVAQGVVAIELATGEMHIFHANAVIIATGGYGRIWKSHPTPIHPLVMGLPSLCGRGCRLKIWNFFEVCRLAHINFSFKIYSRRISKQIMT